LIPPLFSTPAGFPFLNEATLFRVFPISAPSHSRFVVFPTALFVSPWHAGNRFFLRKFPPLFSGDEGEPFGFLYGRFTLSFFAFSSSEEIWRVFSPPSAFFLDGRQDVGDFR